MPTFSDIRGQERAIALLRQALGHERVHHAYLFCGPARADKVTTGLAFASALNCLEDPGEGCGKCPPCQKIAAGIHPDVKVLEREGAAQIVPIDAIRREVISRVALLPHEGRARVFLVEEATALQKEAANALLKTLEEPPDRTHFVLATTTPDRLLSTIRSRCQRIPFAATAAPIAPARDGDGDDSDASARPLAVAKSLWGAITGESARDPAQLAALTREAAQERSEIGAALEILADRLHAEARARADSGNLLAAATLGSWAREALAVQLAIARHNAHGQLALDGMLRRIMRAGPFPTDASAPDDTQTTP